LGGRYELVDRSGIQRWTSTALAAGVGGGPLRARPPEDYTAPPLTWLRGLALDAQMNPHVLSAHADVLMDTQASAPAQREPSP
jgi:hypothetical protein